MLVLTRKTQERIHIGDNITISILKLKGNTVRIGIEAPRDVRVLRGELPTFDGTFEIEVAETATSPTVSLQTAPNGDDSEQSESEQSEEEATVSELEWEVLKRITARRKPCLAVRRCGPAQNAAAPLAAARRATSLAAATVAVRE